MSPRARDTQESYVVCGTVVLVLLWATCGIAWAADPSQGMTTEASEPTAQPVVRSVIRRPDPTDQRVPAPSGGEAPKVTIEIKPNVPLDRRGPAPAERRQRTHGRPTSIPDGRERVRAHIGPITPIPRDQAISTPGLGTPTVQAWKLDESGQKTDQPAAMKVLRRAPQPSRQRQ